MDKTIKLQEEFEGLIFQLERLRDINELTSSNTENTQLVISKVDALVRSTNEFRQLIEQDYNQKNTHLRHLVGSIESSIASLNNSTDRLRGEFSSTLNASMESYHTHLLELNKKLDFANSYTSEKMKSLSEMLVDLQRQIDTQTLDLIKSHNDTRIVFQDELEKTKAIVQNSIYTHTRSLQTLTYISWALIVVAILIILMVNSLK